MDTRYKSLFHAVRIEISSTRLSDFFLLSCYNFIMQAFGKQSYNHIHLFGGSVQKSETRM